MQESSLRFDGSAYRTMLRNDAYWFSRLGVYHRARRQHRPPARREISPAAAGDEQVGGPLDYFQWAAILRSVSALTAYHWVYRESVKPWLVADLLILNDQMPRSLASCYEQIVRYLDQLAQRLRPAGPGAAARPRHPHAAAEQAMEEIFQPGLHEFISDFIAENNQLGAAINEQYLV